MYFLPGSLAGPGVVDLDRLWRVYYSTLATAGRPSCAIPPTPPELIGWEVHDKARCSTRDLTREESVHSRTPVLLAF